MADLIGSASQKSSSPPRAAAAAAAAAGTSTGSGGGGGKPSSEQSSPKLTRAATATADNSNEKKTSSKHSHHSHGTKNGGDGGGGSSSSNLDSPQSAAAHILSLGDLDVDRRLDFLSTNRVVAALEKAVERLQLLSLLDAAAAPENGGDDCDGDAGNANSSNGRSPEGGEGSAVSKTHSILARFAVDTTASSAAAAAAGGGGGGGKGATAAAAAAIQEALTASTASRPAATFVSLEYDNSTNGGNGSAAQHDASAAATTAVNSRRTAAQVTAVLSDAAAVSRRGRPTVAEMLDEQRRLEGRYGELLRAVQILNTSANNDIGNTGSNSARVAAATALPGEAAHLRQCFTHLKNPERAAVSRELRAVSQRLRDHSKLLCTLLKDSPNDGDNWRKIANERAELMALLTRTIGELMTGYAESRRGGGGGSGGSALDGSFRGGGAGSSLRRSDSRSSLLSGANGGDGGGGSQTRCGSLQSDHGVGPDGGSSFLSGPPSTTSQQQQQQLKRFGSTMQMRRVVRTAVTQAQVPLSSLYSQFARKIAQEAAAQRWADDLVRKERELNQNVKQLQADLVVERAKKERELADRQGRIDGLRVELRELKRALKQRSDEAKEKAEAAGEALQRHARAEEAGINDACEAVKREITVEERTHALFAQHLQDRTAAMDALGTEWLAKNPHGIKRAEVQKLDAEQTRAQCSERLATCDTQAGEQAAQRTVRMTAVEAEEKAAEDAEGLRVTAYEAASKLQSAVRAMLTREAVGKLKKKKKGGKRKKSSTA